ncbi:popld domain-containing protein [Cystoisospora suis]|uniref:Popld domain-containing protein n=1 Tax=Cystoisospora suis TaxID=483139 RepID=A0A2C6L651_9APIC|nr:popld domain-containing protein [Cystoisospora suis]
MSLQCLHLSGFPGRHNGACTGCAMAAFPLLPSTAGRSVAFNRDPSRVGTSLPDALPPVRVPENDATGAASSSTCISLQDVVDVGTPATRPSGGAGSFPPLPQLLSIPALVRAREQELRELLNGLKSMPHYLHHQQQQKRELKGDPKHHQRLEGEQKRGERKVQVECGIEGFQQPCPAVPPQRGVAKRAFQRLQIELRRRCMSYNPYRVPRRCRRTLLEEFAKAPPRLSRRVRKDRRRPKSLLSLYNKRAAYPRRWLATHFFHAKRFHMVNVWGYRLASHPTQRCQRKLYRYSRHKVLIHDRSYMQLLELQGMPEDLMAVLRACGADISLAFSRPYLCGSQRGRLLLHAAPRTGDDRKMLISPVEFLWKPAESVCEGPSRACHSVAPNAQMLKVSSCQTASTPGALCPTEELRTLWLWVHPSASEAAEAELHAAGQLLDKESRSSPEYVEDCRVKDTGNDEAYPTGVSHVSTRTRHSVTIRRVDDISWFELTGPHALALAALSLKTPSNRNTNSFARGFSAAVQDTASTQGLAPASLSRAAGPSSVSAAHPPCGSNCSNEKGSVRRPAERYVPEPAESVWRAMVRTTLRSGCCPSEPPAGAVLPLEVFLPPLLGPFHPRTRRLPGVPSFSDCPTDSSEPRPWQAWWDRPFPSSRLFEEAGRQHAAEVSSKWPWHPGRRSRKRQDVRKLLLRLKRKQQGRHPTDEREARSGHSRPPEHSTFGMRPPPKGPDYPPAESTASGLKRGHNGRRTLGDAELLADGTDEKSRKQGLLPSLMLQGVSADTASLADAHLVMDAGDEDLGERVSVAELKQRPEDAPHAVRTSKAPAVELPSAPLEFPRSRFRGTDAPGIKADCTDHERGCSSSWQEVGELTQVKDTQRGPALPSPPCRDRAVPCLVIWRSVGSASTPCELGSSPQKARDRYPRASSSCPLPLLPVQARRPSSFSSGIDLLLPANGGAARLFALLCRYGARPIGCRDRRKLLLETGEPDFPFDFPDTVAGSQFELCCAWQEELRYRRKAPAKRASFGARAAARGGSPFLPMWQLAGFPFEAPAWSRKSLESTPRRCCNSRENNRVPAAVEREEQLAIMQCHGFAVRLQDQKACLPAIMAKSMCPSRFIPAALFSLMPELAVKSKEPFHPRGYNSDAPLIPPMPPVSALRPSSLGFFAPITVLRPTRLDVLRVVLKERRRRITNVQRTETGVECQVDRGTGRSFHSSPEVFLAELSRQLRLNVQRPPGFDVLLAPHERPAGHSRQSTEMLEVGGKAAGEARESSPGLRQTVTKKSASLGARLHGHEESYGPGALPSRNTGGAVGDCAGVKGELRVVKPVQRNSLPAGEILQPATEKRRSLENNSLEGCSCVSFPRMFVPVQVESHLRGVPRRLCELYLMTEDDLHGLLGVYHSKRLPSRSGVSEERPSIRATATAGVTTQLDWMEPVTGLSLPKKLVAREPNGASTSPRRLRKSVQKTGDRSSSAQEIPSSSIPETVVDSRRQRQFFILEEPLPKGCRSQPSSGRKLNQERPSGRKSDQKKPGMRRVASVFPNTERSDPPSREAHIPSTQQFILKRQQTDPGSREGASCGVELSGGRRQKQDSGGAISREVEHRAAGEPSSLTSDGCCRQQLLPSAEGIVSTQRGGDSAWVSPGQRVEMPKAMRELIGFVTTGHHSLLRGKGFGVGCVAADGFLTALRIHGRVCGPLSQRGSGVKRGGRSLLIPLENTDYRKITLFVWMRNFHSQRYLPACMSLIVQD